jgi:hypothetical protein
MYITAGEVMKKITGKNWGQEIHDRFFQPLGMTRSITSIKDLDKKGNYATPHSLTEGKHNPIPWEDWETIAATGGIISSVKDMAQWMIFNLNHGIWKGDTLLSKDSRNMIWTIHNPFSVNHTDADNATHLRGYALGWSVSDYHGRLRIGHTGGYSGMLSAVALIPDEKLGVVILTNGLTPIYSPLVNYTIDAFLKVQEKDLSGLVLKEVKEYKDHRIDERKKARVMNTKPTLSLDQYAGEYKSDNYGKITVKQEGGKLKIYFEHTPDYTATLEHWHYDVFEIKWDNADLLSWFSFGTVKFELDNNNKVTGLQFDVPNNDIFFEELKVKKIN